MSEVLIVGAGPTGLTLAAQLHAHGGRVRIVERRFDRRESRAFIVHPRTLEVLEPLGLASRLVARGDPGAEVRIHAGRRAATIRLVGPGTGDCAYPFLLAIPQVTVEEVLEDHLREVGVEVERGVELTSLVARSGSVSALLDGPGGRRERTEAAYVIGCDGVDSTVRRQAGIPFPSRTYRSRLLLADLEVDGDLEAGTINGYIGSAGVLFLFPSPAGPSWRLLTVSPSQRHRSGAGSGGCPSLAELQESAERFSGGSLALRDPTWTTEIQLRRGQATRYRAGRVLLAGDAAHVHSPAGAQGMNTGIQDACNLGWKLAMVTARTMPDSLLDSYEIERWPVARRVRQLTDLAFVGEAADLRPLAWLRRNATPLLLPLARDRTLPGPGFKLLAGMWIRYRRSPIVHDAGPRLGRGLRAGDRLVNGPVVHDGQRRWLHELLRPPGFHLLLCGRPGAFAPEGIEALQRRSPVPLGVHHLSPEPGPGALGDLTGRLLARLGGGAPAVYLVRPDGYLALRSPGPGLGGVASHLTGDMG